MDCVRIRLIELDCIYASVYACTSIYVSVHILAKNAGVFAKRLTIKFNGAIPNAGSQDFVHVLLTKRP